MASNKRPSTNLLIMFFGTIAVIFIVYLLFFKEDKKTFSFKMPNSTSELKLEGNSASFEVSK